jgi:hypothetical protein
MVFMDLQWFVWVSNVVFGVAVNSEALHRVAQNMNPHMLHSLAQVASQTPHYPTTPGGYTLPTYPNTVSDDTNI